MSLARSNHMRAFKTLCILNLHIGLFLAISALPVFAQTFSPITPKEQKSKQPSLPLGNFNQPPPVSLPAPLPNAGPSSETISPQFNSYILGPGDVLGVVVQRPPGAYRLGPGDIVAVSVQRFPDLSFQAIINPDGNVIVPLLGPVRLQNLTLQQAQERIRAQLNRYVVDPIVVLSLAGQRPDLSFSAQVNPEGNIFVPQAGNLSVQGLTLDEAQEKIRLALNHILTQSVVAVSLAGPRPAQVTITGEVTRPGIYPVNSIVSRVSDALLLAGGSTMMGDLRKVEVHRKLIDGSVITQMVDLYSPLLKGGGQPNLHLQDGDAIVIPRGEIGTHDGYDRNLVARSSLATPQIRIRVLNYSAGGIVTLPLPNGSTFIDALSGINLDSANIQEIALIRFDPEKGKAVTQKLNAKKALSGDPTQNVALRDNDVIVVGRNLITRITNAIGTVTRPFFDIQTFLNFFGF